MKKIISLVLALTLLIGGVPINAFAASSDPYICYDYEDCTETGDIYDVIDDCPVRAEPKNTGKVLARLKVGMFVSVKEVKFISSRLTRWARIEYSAGEETKSAGEKTKSAWVFIGNLEKHRHTFTTVMKSGRDNLRVCYRCGHSICQTDGQLVSGNISSILAQTILGDFSNEKMTFLGFIGRCIASECPLADIRDIAADLWYGASWQTVTMDIIGILPLVSIAKIYAKNSDMLPEAVKHGGKLLKNAPEAAEVVIALDKYDLPESVLETFLYGNRGLNKAQNGVHGAHNMNSFLDSLKNVDGSELNRFDHPSVKGVYDIEYNIKKADGVTVTARENKTVYDPDVISDMEMMQMMLDAFSNPSKVPGSDGKFVGKASNGLWFVAAIDEATNTIKHVYITIKDMGAKYDLQ